jgi:DNA modification methylase
MTNEEYCEFTRKLFAEFDKILKPNGVVLYNICYGSENTTGMFEAINAIITQTQFTVADVIVWKKSNAFPNSCSSNKLTRIWEFVFVLCRKTEFKTFQCNKKIKSYRATGQPAYENIFNFVEAKNNDGSCPYNKATYSSELCKKLLSIYARDGDLVYDPFCGSGTTAVACKSMGLDFIGSEISTKQCEWAKARIETTAEMEGQHE